MVETYRHIERGAIHFLETDAGATLVCAASLSTGNDVLTEFNLPTTGKNYENPE